jgi:hypothetical protein
MHKSLHILPTAISFLCLLMASFMPLPAYSAALSLDYSVGFNGQFQLNTWTPVTVVLENRDHPISATLEIVVTSGSEYQQDVYPSTYAVAVELPTGSRKRYAFTVMIPQHLCSRGRASNRFEKTLCVHGYDQNCYP